MSIIVPDPLPVSAGPGSAVGTSAACSESESGRHRHVQPADRRPQLHGVEKNAAK